MRKTRVISFVSQKGGVGKTTNAVNIGYFLSQKGKKVCLFDIDPQAALTKSFGITPTQNTKTGLEFLTQGASFDECIQRYHCVDVLPASKRMEGLDRVLIGEIGSDFLLAKKIKNIVDGSFYDFLLIDSPPNLGKLAINAMTASKEIFITLQCEYLPLETLIDTIKSIQLVQTDLKVDTKISGIILTMVNPHLNLAKDIIQKIKETKCFQLLFDSYIRRNTKLAEAPGNGKPIGIYAPQSSGAKDYKKLTDEILSLAKNNSNFFCDIKIF